ncbi:MAG: DUF4230 domain-containing protein [Leadbetterella sp.]
MTRFWIKVVGLFLAIVCIILAWEYVSDLSIWGKTESKTKHHQILTKITSMGKMELVKYNFKDIVEQEIVQQILPNPKALLIVEGESVGCINLQKLKASDIETRQDTLYIRLPAPEICYAKIDHAKSKIYETSFAFLNEKELLNEAYKKAEESILKGAIEQGILEQTRQNAQTILKPIISLISEKPVKIYF